MLHLVQGEKADQLCRRIATEIRLDKEMDRSKGQTLSAEMLRLLDDDAARTWQLVYTAEISCVHPAPP